MLTLDDSDRNETKWNRQTKGKKDEVLKELQSKKKRRHKMGKKSKKCLFHKRQNRTECITSLVL
jgi:predicted Fe-S protein YdhL (DUF1289 family)